LIYLDEFSVQGGLNKNYGWGVKGKEMNINVLKKDPTRHCCVALSNEKVEGLKIINNPFTSETF